MGLKTFVFFGLFLLLFTSCTGGSGLGGGGSPPPGGITPPTEPPPTLQGAAPPLDAGAVGPMTDYTKAVLILNCGQSSCLIKPDLPFQGDGDSDNECEYTYKIKGSLQLSNVSIGMPDRVLRVLDKETDKFRDVVTDATGGFEIVVTVDATPQIEFWATDLSPRQALTETWQACSGTCILNQFLKLNLADHPSCEFLTTPAVPLQR